MAIWHGPTLMSLTRVRPEKPSRSGTRRVLTGSVLAAVVCTCAAATVGSVRRLASQALRAPTGPAAPHDCASSRMVGACRRASPGLASPVSLATPAVCMSLM